MEIRVSTNTKGKDEGGIRIRMMLNTREGNT